MSLPVRAQAEDDRASALLWLWYGGGASVGLRLPSSKYRRKMIRTRSASSSTTTILRSFACRGHQHFRRLREATEQREPVQVADLREEKIVFPEADATG